MNLAPFLASSAVVDGNHPSVQELAASARREDQLGTIRTAYELVRDHFAHSYDIGATEVSVSASDVIQHGHGICFAKAHLLAALLRANDIAATRSLLAVWLDGTWRRLDPRGNKPNTAGPFAFWDGFESPTLVRLATAERLSDRKDSDRKDIGGTVEDLLTDVSGSWHDLQLPAEGHAEALGDLPAMLEVP